jgi:hypothetical protein
MTNLTIAEDKMETLRQQRLYSNIIGKNLFNRIVKEFWLEILFQFGFNKNIIDRMVKKGLLGWEIDILAAIRENRENLRVKYTKRWEFDLFKWLLNKLLDTMYLKPVCMLSLFRTSDRWLTKLTTMDYDKVMFDSKSNKRRLIDRTNVYDALIRFICELHEQQEKLTTQQFERLLEIDFSQSYDSTSPAGQLYIYFSSFYLHEPKRIQCKIQRKAGLSIILPAIYSEIRKRYSEQGIGDIKKYCEIQCGPLKKIYHNLHYINFAMHGSYRYKWIFIPNHTIQSIRNFSAQVYKEM